MKFADVSHLLTTGALQGVLRLRLGLAEGAQKQGFAQEGALLGLQEAVNEWLGEDRLRSKWVLKAKEAKVQTWGRMGPRAPRCGFSFLNQRTEATAPQEPVTEEGLQLGFQFTACFACSHRAKTEKMKWCETVLQLVTMSNTVIRVSLN